MFGTKLRTWMEAHIVRSKKKKDRKKGDKGLDSNCNSPRNHGPGRSPALYQVHPVVDSATRNVDVSVSSTTSAGTGSVSLSSPESAYSTGYSTDGTSPGTSFPPEYYINIRTGTHYFQRNGNAANAVNNNNNNNNSNTCNNNNNNSNSENRSKGQIGRAESSGATLPSARRHGRFDENVDLAGSARAGLFAPRNTSVDHEPSNGFRAGTRSSKIRGSTGERTRPQDHDERRHRQSESFSGDSSTSNLAAPGSHATSSLLSPTIQSPRERSRIRTNPWLSTGSSVSCANTFKFPCSSFRFAESSGSAVDVNAASVRAVRTRKEFKQESLSAGRSPINHNWRIASGLEIRAKMGLTVQRRNSISSSSSSSSSNSNSNSSIDNSSCSNGSVRTGGSENGNDRGNGGSSPTSVTRSVRSSEDDITLNEMMGKFDESYVYEKETDILSDSDPTDCEDYVESLSDADAVRDAADEPLDNDDLDYIDNGCSFLELDDLDRAGRFPNTGHCTYFAVTGELARRASKLRESLMKRRGRDETAMLHRTIGSKGVPRKQPSRQRKSTGELLPGEKRSGRSSQRRKPANRDPVAGSVPDDEAEVTANLNRVLVERMLLKNSGFNQGSRSVGGTPICMRRKKQDANVNLSPMRSCHERPSTVRADLDPEILVDKRRSNSVSYLNGNAAGRRPINGGSAYVTTFASEIALIEADKEADRKYRELILEAENILANMEKTGSSDAPVVPSPSRKLHYGLANKRVELIKNAELNIELALSKSRNYQPELQSGSIRDLEHTSPKRQQFAQPSSPLSRFRANTIASRISPLVPRREQTTLPSQRRSPECNGVVRGLLVDRSAAHLRASFLGNDRPSGDPGRDASRTEFHGFLAKEEGVTSSSSDSEERCDVRRRPPLMTFRSVDMGPVKEGSSYCPQSEPVKRKVYAGSTTYGRIQKTLGEQVTLRSSDGDTATDPDTDDSRRSLREKVARLRRERQIASPRDAAQDSLLFQRQLSQLRRQMLVQTIQGLKRSLEDQSATLKQACLEPMIGDRLP